MIFSSYLVTTATVLFETRQKQILKKLSLLILSSTDVYTKMLEGQYGIILPWHGLGVHKRVNIHS